MFATWSSSNVALGPRPDPAHCSHWRWWYLQRPGCRNAAIWGLGALKELVLRCCPSWWRGSQGSVQCLVPGQCKPCPASLACAGPMLPEVLTCHGGDIVAWLQAVRCRHYPFLVDDGRAAEAHTMAVHQINLWEQKEITAMNLCKSVGKKSGTWGFCLAIGQAVFRSYRPSAARDAAPGGLPAPLSPALSQRVANTAPYMLVPHCTSSFAARLGGHKTQHETQSVQNTSTSAYTS